MRTTLPPIDPKAQAALDEAAEALSAPGPLTAVCHVAPDGDALGSILALALSLGREREVTIGWGSETVEIPAQYAFLPGIEHVRAPSSFPTTPSILAVDCASADRLGVLRERFEQAPTLVNLDHHVSNTRFGTIDVVDEHAPSSSELVLRLLERMDAPIDADVATCLYTGLVTDTGRFSYASVTPRAHAAAARLIELGARPDVVSQAVFESLPFAVLKTLGIVLDRCELTLDPPFVVTYLHQSDMLDGVTLDDTEEFIDFVRKIRDADVAAVLKEQPEGTWKVSLRSKGGTDVGAIAQRLGGGGHTLAAGFTSPTDLFGTIELLRTTLREKAWSRGGMGEA